MKKRIAILFLILYINSTTELHQLLKLPVLMEHFFEHQSQNNNLTFFEFLSMHYSQEDDRDGDKEKDSKLPFKSHSFCNSSISFITLNTEVNYTFTVLKVFKERKSIINFYNFLVSSSHLKAIWQPPQIC